MMTPIICSMMKRAIPESAKFLINLLGQLTTQEFNLTCNNVSDLLLKRTIKVMERLQYFILHLKIEVVFEGYKFLLDYAFHLLLSGCTILHVLLFT